MTDLKCRACKAETYTKNGTVRGLQRTRCKVCGCSFTDTPPRGKPAAVKALAVLLYAMGNMSFGGIGRLSGAGDVAVLNWIRQEPKRCLDLMCLQMPKSYCLMKCVIF